MKKSIKGFIVILALFLLLLILVAKSPLINKYYNKTSLIINEVMASNKTTIYNSEGRHFDYIELYNGGDKDINLKDYFLSDNSFDTKKWKFPEVTIKAKDYLLIYASGLDKYENGELHTNFKLSKDGEVVVLSDKDAEVISKVIYVNQLNDISYGYDEKTKDYVYYYNGTPLKANDSLYENEPITESSSPYKIRINEYLINNSIYKNDKGELYPVIELYNYGDKKVSLKGFSLENGNKEKYTFKEVDIEPNGYFLVYLSGKDDGNNTNFTFSDTDDYLIFKDNRRNVLNELNIKKASTNYSYGLYNDVWHLYSENSLGKENGANFVKEDVTKNIVINEVSLNPEAIEIKNISNDNINLKGYSMALGNGKKFDFPEISINAKGFLVVDGSDSYAFRDGVIYTGFHVDDKKDTISLYNNGVLVDEFTSTKLNANISCGLLDGKTVIFKDKTLGNENSSNIYTGYLSSVEYSHNNLYVENGTKIKLNSIGDIYYTLDGSFPNRSSTKYTGEITINKDTVLKTIAYKDNYVDSDITSRTYIVGRKSTIPVVSVTTSYDALFGSNGLISNFSADLSKKVSMEYYEADGSLGFNIMGDATMAGMDSRLRDQKSIAIYLRKAYGTKEVTYPLFKDAGIKTYSSFTLRNAGEDPKGIRIMDTALTYPLRNINLDIQDYRSVAVYLNGSYYGHYNLRERLNGDYLETNYGYDKTKTSLMKYHTPKMGSVYGYDQLYNYIVNHDPRDNATYEYLESQIDVEELANYWIVQSFYGNTDLGNIRYYKNENDKWRWMLFDLDWSMWNMGIDFSYPIKEVRIPTATSFYSAVDINRRLYHNPKYRELYLTRFGSLLKNELKPDNMNKVIDELAAEIDNEMPYHISRWHDISSYDRWKSNIERFKNTYKTRYDYVVANLRSTLSISGDEYNKYFNGL